MCAGPSYIVAAGRVVALVGVTGPSLRVSSRRYDRRRVLGTCSGPS